jgi:diketogulonate reductase-like aldo/keto reductase
MFKRREFLKLTAPLLAMTPLALSFSAVASAQKQIATRPIPASGEALPVIGFGQSSAFRNGELELSSRLLDVLIEMGGRFVDTAAKGQKTLGLYMDDRDAHEQLFLGTNIFSASDSGILNDIHQARQVQGKSTLDLVLLRSLDDLARQWQTLLDGKQAGLTRYVGFAMSRRRYYEPVMRLMETGSVDFVQVNYSILEPQAADELLPLAHEKGVAIVTNRPFINGQYFELVRGRQLPDWAQKFDCNSWAQFSLKYILGHPAVNCVLTETTKTKHAIDNLSAGFGRLPDEPTRQRMRSLIMSFMTGELDSRE